MRRLDSQGSLVELHQEPLTESPLKVDFAALIDYQENALGVLVLYGALLASPLERVFWARAILASVFHTLHNFELSTDLGIQGPQSLVVLLRLFTGLVFQRVYIRLELVNYLQDDQHRLVA